MTRTPFVSLVEVAPLARARRSSMRRRGNTPKKAVSWFRSTIGCECSRKEFFTVPPLACLHLSKTPTGEPPRVFQDAISRFSGTHTHLLHNTVAGVCDRFDRRGSDDHTQNMNIHIWSEARSLGACYLFACRAWRSARAIVSFHRDF